MIRKQVYISKEDERNLKEFSTRWHRTEAALVREALKKYFTGAEVSSRGHTLDAIVGIGKKGRRDGAINHDYYLYGAPKKQQ